MAPGSGSTAGLVGTVQNLACHTRQSTLRRQLFAINILRNHKQILTTGRGRTRAAARWRRILAKSTNNFPTSHLSSLAIPHNDLRTELRVSSAVAPPFAPETK